MNKETHNLEILERVRLEIGDKLILKGIEINDLRAEDLDELIQAKLLDEEMDIDSFSNSSIFYAKLLGIRGI